MVLAIENVDQLPSNSSDDSDSNEVSSKSEARAIANDVLDSSDWIHSVDEGEFSYRVNYGRENEDRVHRAIIVEKVMVVPQNGMAMSGTINTVIAC